LQFSYVSHFFGHDLRTAKVERAFLGNYQKVGLYDGHEMVLLGPNKSVERTKIENSLPTEKLSSDGTIVDDAIAFYQTASFLFKKGLLKISRGE
jgi:hypothetical protein